MTREDLPTLATTLDPVTGHRFFLVQGRVLPIGDVEIRPAYVGERVSGLQVGRIVELRVDESHVPEIPWQEMQIVYQGERRRRRYRVTDHPRSAEDIHD